MTFSSTANSVVNKSVSHSQILIRKDILDIRCSSLTPIKSPRLLHRPFQRRAQPHDRISNRFDPLPAVRVARPHRLPVERPKIGQRILGDAEREKARLPFRLLPVGG